MPRAPDHVLFKVQCLIPLASAIAYHSFCKSCIFWPAAISACSGCEN
jgi:hypothetical protein